MRVSNKHCLLSFFILVISHSGFESGTLVLIASVPGHCVSLTFYQIFMKLIAKKLFKQIKIFMLDLLPFESRRHLFMTLEISLHSLISTFVV